MKQRITFQRTETITFEFDYKVDPHSKANLEYWINQGYCGGSPIGRPEMPVPLALLLSEWKLQSSVPPPCVCTEPEAKAKPKARPRSK